MLESSFLVCSRILLGTFVVPYINISGYFGCENPPSPVLLLSWHVAVKKVACNTPFLLTSALFTGNPALCAAV